MDQLGANMIQTFPCKRQAEEAADFLRSHLAEMPELLIHLGTGLGDVAKAMEVNQTLDYSEIPYFPCSTVSSHAGRLHFGRLAGKKVAILQGRFHYYEGYSAAEVAFPIRVLALLGVKLALITNASGGLNPAYRPGAIMAFADHIYLLPDNPLRGPNVDAWGPRFPNLSTPYDPELRHLARTWAKQLDLDEFCEGTYACIPGPSLETPAETRYLRLIGADTVGMSSVPEILVALHAGLRVLALSVVANVNDPDNFQPVLLEDIITRARQAEPRLTQLILAIVGETSL